MRDPRSARSVLRAATAAEHERVDQAFGRFDLSHPEGYRAFLRAQAQPLLSVEAAIDAFDPRGVLPDWPERRRGASLAADLAELGLPVPAPEPFRIATQGAALGAIYVLEGSRLGGAMLSRNVPMDLPARFIRCAPAPRRWRDLIEVLDSHLTTPERCDAAVSAARTVFDRFEQGACQHGRMPAVE